MNTTLKKTVSYGLICFLFALLFIANANNSILAVPASPVIHSLRQADGTEFQAKQWGDEWQHGWETLDGYPILYDESLKDWVYAKQDTLGKLTTSNLVVGEDLPFGISRHLRSTKGLTLLQSRRAYIKSTPSTGDVKVPVVLINFSDTQANYSSSDFQSLLFGSNPTGSMSDYYSEVSYANLSLCGEVKGWIKADHEHNYYGQDGGHGQKFGRSGELVKEAVQKVDEYVDFSQYDNDGDGYVDCVIVVHQGPGQEESGNSNDIWSHRYWLNYWNTGVYYTDDGVTVDSYTMQPEKINSSLITIGVFCHEFGHTLGLPDLYDTDYSSDGIGNWGLMSGGNWNKTNQPGDTPAHLMAWCKWYLGWVSPTQVSGSMDDELINLAESYDDVYQLLDNPGGPGDWNSSGSGSGEYFLVENRQKLDFDTGLPGAGLLIWHIDESQPDNDNEAHKLVDLEAADGKNDLDNPDDGNEGDGGDPFPGSSANRTFNDSSNPNSKLYDGSSCGVSVTEISDSGFTMTADLVVPQANHSPNTPPTPTGSDTGTPGTFYTFTTTTTDPDGDQVAYKFDWGDGTQSGWTSYVNSGEAASQSHSWSNEGTYSVKTKAKDTQDAESGWSDAHQIVIAKAPEKDLTITSISPDAAQVDEEVNIIVTVANQGSEDVTEDFYVDIYYDPNSPPTKGQTGDSFQEVTQTVPSGESIEVTFTHTFSSIGDHKVWAQIDGDDFVSEIDEDNNIYGPHTITISAVPTPILEVDPTSLAFGEIPKNSIKTMSFRAYNTGIGTLSGTISDDRDWITVSPTSFESNDNYIYVTVDTSIMAELWREYTGTVTVSSNGGTKYVSVSVTPTCVRAFPNPFNPKDGELTFWGTGIPYTTIKIFTLSGELVRILYEDNGSDKIYWDGRNNEGVMVRGGVYLYVTVNSQERNIGRIVIEDNP